MFESILRLLNEKDYLINFNRMFQGRGNAQRAVRRRNERM